MLSNLLQLYGLTSALIETGSSVNNCPPNWFGARCWLKCHCQNAQHCSADGQCPNNGPCETGYFGPACQYVSARSNYLTEFYLVDEDDTTCNPHPHATYAKLYMDRRITFTWFRVIVNSNEINISSIKLNNDQCNSMRQFRVSRNILDITCHSKLFVQNVTIEGSLAGSICSLYVSRGRNVALKQQTYQTSTGSDLSVSDPDHAVDGTLASCSQTNVEKDGPEWYLTYHRPVVIDTVRVFSRNSYHHVLRGFFLETWDADRRITNYCQASTATLSDYNLTLFSHTPITVLKITLSLSIPESERSLTICEVETYGENDCTEDYFGLFCENECHCNRNDICSPIEGACSQGCPSGFYGTDCHRNCSAHCLDGYCKAQSGACLQCIPGFHGDDCSQQCAAGTYGSSCSGKCSHHCVNVCDYVHGGCSCPQHVTGDNCLDCEVSFYGDNCSQICSTTCKDQMCNQTTGDCLFCKGTRQGPNCTECPEDFYGDLCQYRCPSVCANKTCDADDGQCISCLPGFTGVKCTKGNVWTDTLTMIILPIVVSLIFLVVCVCKIRRSRRNAEQNE